MKNKILIVDDDRSIVDFLSIFLIREGYEVKIAYNGIDAFDKIKKDQFQLILLDVMMPKMDGFEFIKKIRKFSNVPIIFLTAKDQQEDKIKGFISGCDDYVTKPFDLIELSLRISAIIKRAIVNEEEQSSECIIVKDLCINIEEHTICRAGEEIKVTPKEFDIIVLLGKNVGRIFSSNEIYERIWGEEFLENDNTVLTHIRNLREKLGDSVKNPKYIRTAWGVGYKIEKQN